MISATPSLLSRMYSAFAEGLTATTDNNAVYQSVALSLLALTPLQQEIVASEATRKCVACGRRVGKTMLAASVGTDGVAKGKRVEYWSASDKQTDAFWDRVKKFTDKIPGRYKNETRRIMKIGDGQLQARTGSDPDMLRSDYADLLLIDEAALLPSEVWYEVGSPMLLDTHGTAYFFSTPKRKNWFYLLFLKSQADQTGRYAAWNASTYSNPYLSKQDIDDLTQDMTEETYKQEIMAEFLESGGEVFRNIAACATLQRRDPYEGQFVFGLDWAQKVDSTVITVMDSQTRQMVDMDRFNGVSWELQRGRVRAMYDKWKPSQIIAESNSIGSPNIEALQREGLPVVPFETTAVSKPPLIESLALAFERGEITILDDGVLTGELSAYERKVSMTTGRSQFNAPSGLHDDCVMALALNWYGVYVNRSYGGIHI